MTCIYVTNVKTVTLFFYRIKHFFLSFPTREYNFVIKTILMMIFYIYTKSIIFGGKNIIELMFATYGTFLNTFKTKKEIW